MVVPPELMQHPQEEPETEDVKPVEVESTPSAELVTVEWDDSAAFKRSSAELFAEYRELAKQPGASARQVGDVAKAFGSAARTIEATYEFPFLAHASMEPLNCVVRVGAQDCEVWNG